MDYFGGLDILMKETHVCVIDREEDVVHEAKTASTPETLAALLAGAPSCRRIVFETGRMAPMLFHGLRKLGLPVARVESRQAYQALRTLATHKTDHNDAGGLAQLTRTGFFKPVHVKSLPAHAVRSLIGARKKLVSQRGCWRTKSVGRSRRLDRWKMTSAAEGGGIPHLSGEFPRPLPCAVPRTSWR